MMVNKEIFKIADQLKGVVNDQMKLAQQGLLSLPEGGMKEDLKNLLQRASSGKVTQADAQREIKKIIDKHAG